MSRLWLFTVLTLLLAGTAAGAETLTLQECLQKAAVANPELKVVAHDLIIAGENIPIAASGYLPRVDFQGGYTVQKDPQSVIIQGLVVPTQDTEYGFFSASLHQTIYDFGRTSGRYGRAKALAEAVSHNYDARQKEVFLRVVEAYYGVLESRKILLSAEEEVVQMTDHVKVAQNLYEQGVVTRNDLLQAEVQLANSRQRRLSAANRVKNSRLLLNYLIGAEPAFRAEPADSPELEPVPPPVSVAAVLDNRPEIKALKNVVRAGEFTVRETGSAWFPELFARAGIDYVENSRVEEQAIIHATVGLQVNLFDGLASSARHRQSVRELSRDQESLRELEAGIRLEYRTAFNDANVALERIDTVRQSIRQAEENLRINKNRYQEQVGTATDVIDAQTLLTQTSTEYHRAVFDYQVAVARVKKAMGEL